MRFTILLVAVMFFAAPARAQEAEIRGVITSQMRAFASDDFARAFEFASPGIRDLFGTSETFGRMVRQGYPMVHRPGEVTFLGLESRDGGFRQRVMIRDGAGSLHLLDYDMVPGPDGWLIDGVRILDGAAIGA